MAPLALIVVFELVLTTGILGLSSHPRVLNNTKHQISNVLGVQQIAQVEEGSDNSSTTTPDQSSSTSNPPPASDNSTPSQPTAIIAPAEPDSTQTVQTTATPAPADTTNSASTPAPTASEVNPTASPTNESSSGGASGGQLRSDTSPTETPGLFDQEINPSPTTDGSTTSSAPSEQINPLAMPQSAEEPLSSSISTQSESNTVQTQAVLNPDELINSSDNINSQSITEAKKEDDQLAQTQDPKEQTNLLVTFATDKVKDMSNFTKSDDFTSTNFAAQRFNNQMDQAISNLDKLPKKDQAPVRQQLSNFCDQADSVLRTVELSVPEESEQDIQMARGQCQELKL